MKKYEVLSIEVVIIDAEDIISTSTEYEPTNNTTSGIDVPWSQHD